MIQGGQDTAHSGFTIVETLIVLAVTGILFVSAVLLISGRQAKTEFVTSINSFQQQLQQIINETASGYYPNNGDFRCSGASHPVTLLGGANQQGTNSGCLFLGKAVQFGLGAGNAASQLGVIPMVGNQYVSGSESITTLAEAVPRAAYDATVAPNSVETLPLQYGLKVATSNTACGAVGGMCYTPLSGGAPLATGIAAFLAGDNTGAIATAASSGTGVRSGSQQLSLYAVKSSQPNNSYGTATTKIGNVVTPGTSGLDGAKSISLCVASGTTANQTGLITIDDGLHVTLVIKGNATCA